MLFLLIDGGDIRQLIIELLLSIPVILFALSFHEAAHAFAAYKMGDRTAFNLGRMTINPAKHLDLWGTLAMIVFGFGWAKPVPINARNFKNPKVGMAITGIAGPLANLMLGIVGIFFSVLTAFIQISFFPVETTAGIITTIFEVLMMFFGTWTYCNFVFAVYNLIPVPPFDGSRFIGILLPTKLYFKIMKYERYTFLIVMAINLLVYRVFGIHLVDTVASFLIGVCTIPFSLMLGLISFLISLI